MDIAYCVGDCVYIDLTITSPFGIGKIEEFLRGLDNNFLVKVLLYLRKKDAPCELMTDDEKQEHFLNTYGKNADFHQLSSLQKRRLKQRELFCTQKYKIIPLSQIKGKCFVSCLNDAESLLNFINKEDTFFYSVTFYPKFLAKRSIIREGNLYQADIPPLVLDKGNYYKSAKERDTLVWTPEHNLSDNQVDEFLKRTRIIETLPRALNCSSEDKINNLIENAAIASRDAVLFYGMNLLHQNNYNYDSSLRTLLSSCDRVNVEEEVSKWTSSESELFELGYKKFRKDFNKIRSVFLPWKSFHQIIEYYYVWKTTDNYIEIKGSKPDVSISQIKISRKKKEPVSVIDNYMYYSSLSCRSCRIPLHKFGVSLSDTSDKEYHLCNKCWVNWKKYG